MSALKRVTMTGPPSQPKKNPFSALRETQIISSKPLLPAEIIAQILDYLTIPCLLRFAQVSKRMREMVYDDTRWVQRLHLMGCWNEVEARRRAEEARKKKVEALQTIEKKGAVGVEGVASPTKAMSKPSITVFDAGAVPNGDRHQEMQVLDDGFDAIDIAPNGGALQDLHSHKAPTAALKLDIYKRIRSLRGHARQEYGKVYAALAPLYNDAVQCTNHTSAVVFRTYRDPNQQAIMLANLTRFSNSDMAEGWHQRKDHFAALVAAFESAVSKEFEQALDAEDIAGKLPKYAHVLVSLNGGRRGVELFLDRNPVLVSKSQFGNPSDYWNTATDGYYPNEISYAFFAKLSTAFNEQVAIMDQVFPPSVEVVIPFLQRVGKQVIGEYLTAVFDEAHRTNIETYLKAVSVSCDQALTFAKSLRPTAGAGNEFYEAVDGVMNSVFEPHVTLYLVEELSFFKRKSDTEVNEWERRLSEQDASMTSMFMSNVNRQVDKRDFLTTFKKAVMVPVNVVSAPFGGNKQATAKALVNGQTLQTRERSRTSSGSTTPVRAPSPSISNGNTLSVNRPTTPLAEPPTTELAAKAAILNSRLEGIRSLFSIEVALNLVHMAKSSIERAAVFIHLGNHSAKDARLQCELIFIALLQTLGTRHIQPGFDQAVQHLSDYNPREIQQHNTTEVKPLVTFLELVNVGDLIQQMLDVFFEQEIVAQKLTAKDDFLNPAVKEKKRFEQMLDSRVAAGLNKGIEVLMDEVEYVCATVQKPEDFNPEAAAVKDKTDDLMEIGPSETARRVVGIVGQHTQMLVGSTDKQMLDVFNQEVGMRLFGALCKHLKRQRISIGGSIVVIWYGLTFLSHHWRALFSPFAKSSLPFKCSIFGTCADLFASISDMSHYYSYIATLRNKPLLQYFVALRELAQLYLISASEAKALATLIADSERFHGIFGAEEVYEFAERRADWYAIRGKVERAMYGIGCYLM